MNNNKWDVFISHASEDKDFVARELAESLKSYGVNVWYDEFSLKAGDSLSSSIDKGLINSSFGIVVLSPSFFSKDWPDYELRSMLSKEIGNKKVILPVWYNITLDEIKEHSLYLSDKLAFDCSKVNIEEIIIGLVEIIRPDIYDNYKRRIIYDIVDKQSTVEVRIDPRKVKMKIKHTNFSKEMLLQIKVIQEIFFEVFPISFDETVLDFMTEESPEREIAVWNRLASTYLQWLRLSNRQSDTPYKMELFLFLIDISSINNQDNIKSIISGRNLKLINYEEAIKIYELFNNVICGIDKQDCNIYAVHDVN